MDARNTTAKNNNSKVWIIVLLVLTFPIWIGLAGGLFGLMVGIAGGILGIIAGIFGAIFGILGGMFSWILNPFGWWDHQLLIVFGIILIIILATRSRRN